MSDISAQKEDDFDIEVIDNLDDETPGGEAPPKEVEGDDLPNDDDEISQYSDNVQKRIKQLTYEKHEERRKHEEAAKFRDEAVRYAETVSQENARLQELANRGEAVAVNEASSRIETAIESAKAKYKEAFETGDTDALTEAQSELSGLHVEKSRVEAYTPPQRQQQQQQQAPPEPDQRALDWRKENEWFDKDPAMHGAALGIHTTLATTGYVPGSDAYYTELDTRMRDAFPTKFDQQGSPSDQGGQGGKKSSKRSPGNVVAPAGRSGKTTQKVQLTSTQVALAKRLGLTTEQYAAQMLKDMEDAE